jgi:hypothetical protein
MNRWLMVLVVSGCGASPEYVDEPTAPAPAEAAGEVAAGEAAHPDQDWQCAGSTAATRQQGRLSRHQSVEGFSSRGCNRPATSVELAPR